MSQIDQLIAHPRPSSEIWRDDKLERRVQAKAFMRFIERRYDELEKEQWDRAYAIAVQGAYGLGKTTFLEGLAEELAHNHPVGWVNAWADDTIDDPFTSLTQAIDRALAPIAKGKRRQRSLGRFKDASLALAATTAKGALHKGLSFISDDENASAVVQIITGGATSAIDNLADRLARQQRDNYTARAIAVRNLKSELKATLAAVADHPKKYLPVVIVIDELDRCRPPYAIRMLETVKHLLDVEGLVFLYGVERNQLARAVEGQYGSKFNGDDYLKRFVDRDYRLSEPSFLQLSRYLTSRCALPIERISVPPVATGDDQSEFEKVATFIALWMEAAERISARDVITIFDMLKVFCTVWDYAAQIELAYLLPLIVRRHLGIDGPTSNDIPTRRAPPGWSVDFGVESVGLDGIFQTLRRAVDRNLNDPFHSKLGRSMMAWIDDRIVREAEANSRNGKFKRSGPQTAMKHYHEYLEHIAPLIDD